MEQEISQVKPVYFWPESTVRFIKNNYILFSVHMCVDSHMPQSACGDQMICKSYEGPRD